MSSAKNAVDDYLKSAGFGPRQIPQSEQQQPPQPAVEGENPVKQYLRLNGFGPRKN